MSSLHLTIAVAVALLVHTAAYPVYEPGAYRGSDWTPKYGDKEAKGAKFGGSGRWAQPETRWGYQTYTAEESKPRHEAVKKAKSVAQKAEVKPLEDVSDEITLSDLEEEDEFDLESLLFMEWAGEPEMPPGMPPSSEAAGSEVGYLYELYYLYEYEPGEAPSSAEEPMPFEFYYSYPPEPASLPAAEPYYPPGYAPVYPPTYAPYEAPVPAPEPEAVPAVTVAPPVKKAKKHKKEEPCEECPCECEKGTPCYCYPTLPKRHYPSYYTPQYSPYTYYGRGYQHPYYEPEKPEKVKKPKKVKPPPKPEVEPEPEEEVHKHHKKPKKPAHVKPEPEPVPVEPKPKTKHPVHKEEVPEPTGPTKVGVYPAYGYPHGKYASTYKHYYYGPEEVPTHCKPPHKCESEKYPGQHHAKKTEPEYEEPAKKKKCKKCRKCKRCGPCVEDEHGCAIETHDG